MIEYLVVGSGLAAVSYIKHLLEGKHTFKVVTDDSQRSSQVAGALYNPVILKRFTPVWKAQEQLDEMHSTFKFYEELFLQPFIEVIPVLRKLASIEEQNYWFEAADKPGLSPFLKTALLKNTFGYIEAPFGFGEVDQTGRILVGELLGLLRKYLTLTDQLMEETFHYDELKPLEDGFEYKGIKAKRVVFCEGYGLLANPYFNYLPLHGTKGQLLVIKAPGLKVNAVIKSSAFVIPLGNDLYKIGATYEHTDKNNEVTEQAKQELLGKVSGFVKGDFEVVGQLAGVRPTVADRRPLIGEHPAFKNMFVLNGLGTRGVMIGPYVARMLYKHIHSGAELLPETHIKRFEKRWFKKLKA